MTQKLQKTITNSIQLKLFIVLTHTQKKKTEKKKTNILWPFGFDFNAVLIRKCIYILGKKNGRKDNTETHVYHQEQPNIITCSCEAEN